MMECQAYAAAQGVDAHFIHFLESAPGQGAGRLSRYGCRYASVSVWWPITLH
jgi:hypothetical protein